MKTTTLLPGLCALLLASTGAHAATSHCTNTNMPASNPGTVYQISGDGTTVTDTRTGLTWKRCEEGQAWDAAADGGTGRCVAASGGTEDTKTDFTWAEALTRAAGHSFAGHSDWRLPDVKELRSLVEECRFDPAINNTVFKGAPSVVVWSGSPYAANADYAWGVNFYPGYTTNFDHRTSSRHVRLVRGGAVFAPLPVLSAVGVSGASVSGATLSATSDMAATGYWVVVARNAAAPSAWEVKAGTHYASTTVLASGSAAMSAATAQTFPIAGLVAGTDYDLYFAAEGAGGGSMGMVQPVLPFSTTAASVAGVCGTAAGVATLVAPTTNLCAAGTLSPGGVTSIDGTHTWTCNGTGGGAAAQCAAPGAVAQDGGSSGNMTLALTAGAGCVVEFANPVTAAAGLPTGANMPFGALDFALNSCTGGSATVTVTYSGPVAGMQYWKHINGGWTPMTSGVVLAGNTATITIADNGPYDADPTPGRILDPSGPVLLASSVAPIPTLSQWTTFGLAGLMGLLALGALSRRRQ